MPRFLFRSAVLPSLVALTLVACGSPAPAEPDNGDVAAGEAMGEASRIDVTVTDAFLLEPAAGRTMLSGGLSISATGGDARLIGAEAAFAERVELHTMRREDGMMVMEQIDGIDLADGETVELKGGSDHLMLFGVEDFDVEATYPLTLLVETADGTTISVETTARVSRLGE